MISAKYFISMVLIGGAKREQHIPGHSAEARIARIHKQHAADDDGTGAVERSARCRHSIYGGVAFLRVEIPEQFSVGGRERAKVSVH